MMGMLPKEPPIIKPGAAIKLERILFHFCREARLPDGTWVKPYKEIMAWAGLEDHIF